eukprot:6191402-Pleurochrysis_carterae.AAC.1
MIRYREQHISIVKACIPSHGLHAAHHYTSKIHKGGAAYSSSHAAASLSVLESASRPRASCACARALPRGASQALCASILVV